MYRRVLDPEGLPALVQQFHTPDRETLVSERNLHNFWGDNPAALDAVFTAPEEPLHEAQMGPSMVPRFWTAREDEHAHRAHLQLRMDKLIVIDGEIWRPTCPPGLVISPRTGDVLIWLSGLPRAPHRGIHLDWHFRHRAADALVAMGRNPEDSATYRYAMHAWDFAWEGFRAEGDLRMLEVALRSILKAAKPNLAALGARVSAAYWTGRVVLEKSDEGLAGAWFDEHSKALSTCGIHQVAGAIDMFRRKRELQN
tara:strand:+ start:9154 stop:9915 length:762 start_codon:yes stop_codon:yes gene_type:complete